MPSHESHASPRISAAMIVRDEELVLAGTLAAARRFADEIVVLDTGSVDRTVEIARRQGARVAETRWQKDFSAARNEAIDTVSGSWIVWLDAGEQMSAADASRLREFLLGEADPAFVYALWVRQASAGGASDEQAARLRVMPNRPCLWFEGRVRETLKPSILAAGMDTAMAPGCLVRHPRCSEPVERARRARRNRRLGIMEAQRDGRARLRGWLAQGEAAVELGDPATARGFLQQVVDNAPRGSLESLEAYYSLLTTYGDDPPDCDRRLAVCLAALEQFPLDAQLLCAMGAYMQQKRQFELAARSYGAAVKHGQIHAETWHMVDVGPTAARCLATVLQLLGRHAEAADELNDALARYPESKRLRRCYVDACIQLGRVAQALAAALSHGFELAEKPAQREALCDAIRGACLAAAGHPTPALGFLQAAYAAGCRDPICLKWLAVTLLTNGQGPLAAPILAEWRATEPDNLEPQTYLAALATLANGEPAASAQQQPEQSDDGHWLRLDNPDTLGQPRFGDAHAPSHNAGG